ncbi:hypothetical protein [Candidatus Thiothrix anitrata]|uniref:Phospholipase C/D domain-containing protein n=1 Tax=Candidatus Thiothrix anitrata TaxID=2823902 RepID=A0ABX7WZU1_9GAMM|nr:hypothetical protein [Candidatus Thiothrix anitrata]QTR48951.1 hypothetical protein J8380_11760 [Candidatus Thiothrix anitrata]
MNIDWINIATLLLSGGVLVKLMELVYQALKTRFDSKETAKKIIDLHLDPLMKSADEIVGKTCSLARRDFKELIPPKNTDINSNELPSIEILGILYLYARFWGRIEILHQESLGISISTDKRGELLREFFASLESQKIRLVDRTHQKAIGELATHLDRNGKLRSIGVVEFVSKFKKHQEMQNWLIPLLKILQNTKDKKIRQKVLVYGVVMHALVDTLDPKHHSSHWRPAYPNKLTKQSRQNIRYQVFNRYLKMVKNIDKYLETKK